MELSNAQAEAAAKLLGLIFIQRISESIHVAAALRIADLMADGPKTAEQLAEATDAHAPSLRRTMRVLASYDSFPRTTPAVSVWRPWVNFSKSTA
jgi:hypothetical protein